MPMKIAIIHDWLVTYAGAERVLEQILALYPEADVFAVVDFLPPEERAFLRGKPVKTTFIQQLPGAARRYRHYLPLMPLAIEQLDLRGYDLILSSSHAVAKGVITGPDQIHISYVHSPMRYAWDLQGQYLEEAKLNKGIKGMLARLALHYLRLWDARTALGVDYFIANSSFIARRIEKTYRRNAVVIPPPVDVGCFSCEPVKQGYYVTLSRLVPYKKTDILIQAFAQMPDKQLVVIGGGPDREKLQQQAPANVRLLGHLPIQEVVKYLQQAQAFLFAAEEDFGIAMVEALACGTPVIAFGKGGARDIVCDQGAEPTGIFFQEQTPQAVKKAVEGFEQKKETFQAGHCRKQAERFSTQQFCEQYRRYVEDCVHAL